MCGLVGLFNKNRNGFTKDQQDVFASLLFIDFLRGPDSTGAFLVNNRGDMYLAKEASDSLRFMRSKEYSDINHKAWQDGSALIGHNRKATVGNVIDENAHPFVVDDNIVLVHNGTLWGDHKKIADVEVDSHAIAHAIHEHGDVTKALSSIDGAYALIWYDVANESINLIRNSQRPLWWMETSNSWIWSSEKAMLEFVAGRHNISIKDGPHELPEDTLQTYKLKNQTWEVTDKKITITKPVKQTSYNYNSGGHSSDYGNYQGRRHPYSCAYDQDCDDADFQDIPFKGGARATNLPVVREVPKVPLTEIAETYSTLDPIGTTSHFEREMAKKLNCVITNAEWKEDVIKTYPFGTEVIAEAFDYSYANQKDDTGGYYLYCRICDDRDVLVRMWWSNKISEEQIIQWAGSGYVYKCKVGRKQWRAMMPGAVVERTPGFVVMHADKVTLLFGGGVGDARYDNRKEKQVH